MGGLAQLTGVAAIGTVASIGVLFVGPPGVGVTGLVVFGGLLALAIADDKPDPNPHRVQPATVEPELEHARAQYDLALGLLEFEIEDAVETCGASILADPHWFIVRKADGSFAVEVNPTHPESDRVALPDLVDLGQLGMWMAEVGESCFLLSDDEGRAPVPEIAAKAMARLGYSPP